MNNFSWRAIDQDEKKYLGDMDANSTNEVVEFLSLQGLKPIEFSEWVATDAKGTSSKEIELMPTKAEDTDSIYKWSKIALVLFLLCAIFISWWFCYLVAICAGVAFAFGQQPTLERKVNSQWPLSIIASAISIVIVLVCSDVNENRIQNNAKEERREALLEDLREEDSYNSGSSELVYQAKSWLQSKLKYPSSFKLLKSSTVKKSRDGGYTVRVTYSAKNSFL